MLAIQRVGELLHFRGSAPHVVEAMIDGKAVQPRADCSVAFVSSQLAVSLEKDFLEQILAVFGRPCDPACQRVNSRRVLPVQALECLDVSVA